MSFASTPRNAGVIDALAQRNEVRIPNRCFPFRQTQAQTRERVKTPLFSNARESWLLCVPLPERTNALGDLDMSALSFANVAQISLAGGVAGAFDAPSTAAARSLAVKPDDVDDAVEGR